MRNLKLTLSIAVLTTALSVIAQDRTSNPGEDPNEAMTTDGAGVPNYGCADSNKSCFRNMKHTRLGDDTKAIKPMFQKTPTAGGTSDKGTR